MKHQFLYILLAFLFTASSCASDNDEVVINSELMPYFDSFKTEARKRGIDFDPYRAKISTEIVNIAGTNVIAQCKKYTGQSSIISVDANYWKQATASDKEFYLYHELGHCFLKRNHLDAKDNEGNCISIMHSSKDACRFYYDKLSRDNYLDELFKK
jgi:hypothetical protein